MNRRAAKRLACWHAAQLLDFAISNWNWEGDNTLTGHNRIRFEEAVTDLVEELARRARVDVGLLRHQHE